MIGQPATSTTAAPRHPREEHDVPLRPTPAEGVRSRRFSERPTWPTVAVGGLTAVAVTGAAAMVSREVDPAVGIAAWVTAAVIGTAAIIATSVVEGPRSRRRSASPPESEVRGRERHA